MGLCKEVPINQLASVCTCVIPLLSNKSCRHVELTLRAISDIPLDQREIVCKYIQRLSEGIIDDLWWSINSLIEVVYIIDIDQRENILISAEQIWAAGVQVSTLSERISLIKALAGYNEDERTTYSTMAQQLLVYQKEHEKRFIPLLDMKHAERELIIETVNNIKTDQRNDVCQYALRFFSYDMNVKERISLLETIILIPIKWRDSVCNYVQQFLINEMSGKERLFLLQAFIEKLSLNKFYFGCFNCKYLAINKMDLEWEFKRLRILTSIIKNVTSFAIIPTDYEYSILEPLPKEKIYELPDKLSFQKNE